MFKKGDYFVLTTGMENICFKHGYVFKQVRDHTDISVEKDLLGNPNGWVHYPHTIHSEDNKHREGTWRPATDQEIADYIKANGPVKVAMIRLIRI